MRLTRIEIHGFKSFADRTNLDLPAGLTAIVGPNGCGKSNVIDAVKWALGEQKASALRGAEMLDVVFKGNGARGARNFAEVSLLFDNSDGVMRTEFAEVVITRRLFRSGESEYLINKRSVRLKDVRDLLMDTGLGTGAYSVMEQGRIDAVLSANAPERRRIFEEAAGISRYRARRREAESKLARTQQNLERLADIVEELERRERSLKQQAGRARAYLAARDRIQLLKSRFYVYQYKTLGEQLTLQDTAVNESAESEAEARKDVDAARAEVALLQSRLSELRGHVDQAAEAFRKASGEVEALSERQTSIRERAAEAEERQALLEARFAGLERALAERKLEADEASARFDAVAMEVAGCQAEVDVTHASFLATESALGEARTAEEQRRREARARVESLSRLRNERSQKESQRAALVASRERLDTQLQELAEKKAVLSSAQGELFSGARDLEQTLAVAQQRVDQLRERREGLATELADRDGTLARRREDLAGKDSHRKALDDLIDRREGVAPGAISLLDADLPGVEGMLVDQLRAPAELAEAVEAALGASTQAVMVQGRESGLAALAHLNRLQGGRVLLVPRDGLRAREGAAVGRRLVDCIQVPLEENRGVFEALLGHVRLLESRDELLRCTPDGTTVWVTAEGDLLDERGVLKGGKAGEEGGLIARQAERDSLSEECAIMRVDIEALGVQRTAVAHELGGVEETLVSSQAHARKVHAEQERALEREKQSAARQHAVHRELAFRTGDRRGVQLKFDEAESQLSALVTREQEQETQASSDKEQETLAEERLRARQTDVQAQQEALSGARLELSKRQERREALEAEQRHILRAVEERTKDLSDVRAESEQLSGRREHLITEQAALEERSIALSHARDERAGELQKAREASTEIGNEQSASQERVTEAEGVLEGRASVLSTRRLEAQETRIRRDELRRQVLEELEVDLEVQPLLSAGTPADADAETEETEREGEGEQTALVVAADPAVESEVDAVAADSPQVAAAEAIALAQSQVEEDVDWEAVEAEIEELRGRLSRMGNVNLEAVEELAQVEERLAFLVGQRDDLLQAQVSLADTIQKVNKESRERFQSTFDDVRENFRSIFRKLFRGGRADISLAEGVDILEADIEINAAPPGKDSRTITLLSGGERTLTAVGLLFALFKTRPAPVCLLDEVDAALDETNIDRFCTVLEDFLGKSQFIVVTHARRTMSYADTVFGVTMQEHGVSKVLALTLEEFDAQKKSGAATGVVGTGSGPDPLAIPEQILEAEGNDLEPLERGAQSENASLGERTSSPAAGITSDREELREAEKPARDRLGVEPSVTEIDASAS